METKQPPEMEPNNPEHQPAIETACAADESFSALVQSSAQRSDQAPSRRNAGAVVGLWLRDLVLATCAAVFIIVFLYQPVRVEGTSMLPRLEDRDRVFINKFVYNFVAIQRGDVVVFRYSRDPENSFIKRVIGIPGDRVRIEHGYVWVNGVQLKEPYVPAEFRDSASYAEVVVPEGQYFVMGDHRSISYDSRKFGTIQRESIYGKAAFVYWPARDAGVVH
jgi:signal peptidase I